MAELVAERRSEEFCDICHTDRRHILRRNQFAFCHEGKLGANALFAAITVYIEILHDAVHETAELRARQTSRFAKEARTLPRCVLLLCQEDAAFLARLSLGEPLFEFADREFRRYLFQSVISVGPGKQCLYGCTLPTFRKRLAAANCREDLVLWRLRLLTRWQRRRRYTRYLPCRAFLQIAECW